MQCLGVEGPPDLTDDNRLLQLGAGASAWGYIHTPTRIHPHAHTYPSTRPHVSIHAAYMPLTQANAWTGLLVLCVQYTQSFIVVKFYMQTVVKLTTLISEPQHKMTII